MEIRNESYEVQQFCSFILCTLYIIQGTIYSTLIHSTHCKFCARRVNVAIATVHRICIFMFIVYMEMVNEHDFLCTK